MTSSNRQPHDCLLNHLFRRRSGKTSKLRVTGLCEGNSSVTGEFPAKRASNAENVSIWWRHHMVLQKFQILNNNVPYGSSDAWVCTCSWHHGQCYQRMHVPIWFHFNHTGKIQWYWNAKVTVVSKHNLYQYNKLKPREYRVEKHNTYVLGFDILVKLTG